MSFLTGLKLASTFSEAAEVTKSLAKGVQASGKSSVGDALKLKGLSHISDAAKASGGWKKGFTTSGGRKAMAEGVGKAAPSLGAGAAYAAGAKKAYNKVTEDNQPQGYY